MKPNKHISIISMVFFLSGSSALIFETVWFRVASTVLGSSVWSAAAVLMAFMGGLAIGNGLMAAYGHRVRNPVKAYIIIEAIIGLTGFSVVLILPKVSPLIGSIFIDLSENQGFLSASRFIIACLFLLIPAIAMGATLPVMQKLSQQYDDSFVSSIGRLYGWNTIGAVSGVLLTEFIFIRSFGIMGTAAMASVFNLLIILIMKKTFNDAGIIADTKKTEILQKNSRRYLVAAFFSGMLLLALEIIWFRYLLIAQEGSNIIFAIMLACVLVGIGLGGLVISKFKFKSESIKGVIFLLLVGASISTYLGFYLFQLYFDSYIVEIHRNIQYFMLAVGVLILPTCLISGMIFPLLGECIYRNNQVAASSAGYLTLANTIGAFTGSAIASFYLLPVIGIESSIFIVVLAYLLVSLLLIENIKKQVITVCVVMTCMLIIFPHGMVKKSYEKLYSLSFPNDKNILVFREGLNQTIAYLENKKFDQRTSVRLVTNNYSMSSTAPVAQRYMRLYTYFPYLLSSKIENVLQISYGVGNTAESVIMLPDMKHFDVVDMSPDVLELSHVVHESSGVYPLEDKRTVAHVEDGRFFLQTTKNQYDLITAEPPPPMMAGVVNLYTQEYFQLIYNALMPGGMTTYWLPLHALNDVNALSVIKAFCNVFKTCSLWNGDLREFMLVGSKAGGSKIDSAQLINKWTPVINSELKMMGFDNPEQVFATFIGDYEYLAKVTDQVGPVTDNYPKRLAPDFLYAPGDSKIYSDFFNIKRRKEHFINSSYIKSIFSSELMVSISKEFKREGIITSILIDTFNDVLVDDDYIFWDMVIDYIPNKKRDFVSLRLFSTSYSEMNLLDKVFKEDGSIEEHHLTYIKYLFIDNQFSLLENHAKKAINNNNLDMSTRYSVYRYYLLSKMIMKTITGQDIELFMELSKELDIGTNDQGFEDWLMKNI